MRYVWMFFWTVGFYGCKSAENATSKVFYVHLHSDAAPEKHISNLITNGVYAKAVSTLWPKQQTYQSTEKFFFARSVCSLPKWKSSFQHATLF